MNQMEWFGISGALREIWSEMFPGREHDLTFDGTES